MAEAPMSQAESFLIRLYQLTSKYGDASANSVCQVCPEGRQKVVYLTFDDGPEPGTVEIYEALKSQGVPATFFFVGENVLATEDGTFARLFPGSGLVPGLFRTIFNDPLFQTGNHSQTQARQFYQSYYDTGLRIDAGTLRPSATSDAAARRSVLVDFQLAGLAMSYCLLGKPLLYNSQEIKITQQGYRGSDVAGMFASAGVAEYFPFLTARLPGTNRWRVGTKSDSAWDAGADRDDEADDLAGNGYRIYGWDLEWDFSGGESSMSAAVRGEHVAGADGWWDYYGTNLDKDRPKQSAQQMFAQAKGKLDSFWHDTVVNSNADAQVVILMHDRQFRAHVPGDQQNPYIDELLDFVSKCLARGYKFDVLENYRP